MEKEEPNLDVIQIGANRKMYLKLIFFACTVLLLSGCSQLNPYTANAYNKPVLDHAAFNNLGTAVDYTAKRRHHVVNQSDDMAAGPKWILRDTFDDTKYKISIIDNGSTIVTKDETKTITFRDSYMPDYVHSDFSNVYKSDQHVAVVKRVAGNGEIQTEPIYQKGIRAEIIETSNGNVLFHLEGDPEYDTDFEKADINIFQDKAVRELWDEFYSGKNRAGGHVYLLKSNKKFVYKYFWEDKNGISTQFEFIPKFWIEKSKSYGLYRLEVYKGEEGMYAYDFLPTKNFICADLYKNYYSVRTKQGFEVAGNILLGVVQAYTSTTTTTYNGMETASYNGVYSDQFGSGSLSGYGTSSFSGYSRTYDYSFIGDRTASLLNIAFQGSAAISQIEAAMDSVGCHR